MASMYPVQLEDGSWELGLLLDGGEEISWAQVSDHMGYLNRSREIAGLPILMGVTVITQSGQTVRYRQGDAWTAVGGPTVTIGGMEGYTGHRLGYPDWGSQFIIRPDTPGEGIPPTTDPQ